MSWPTMCTAYNIAVSATVSIIPSDLVILPIIYNIHTVLLRTICFNQHFFKTFSKVIGIYFSFIFIFCVFGTCLEYSFNNHFLDFSF